MRRYTRGTIADEAPWLVNYLVDKRNKTIHVGSAKKVDWFCPSCGKIVQNKSINKVVDRKRIPCDVCGDGISKPEKIVSSALTQIGINYIPQMIFQWSGRKRYDFYIPDYSTIIEVHGSQHYGYGFKDLSGVSFDQQTENDKKKRDMAMENGITNYYVINAADTDAKNIVSQLSIVLAKQGIFAPISYVQCERDALISNVIKAANLWNSGIMTGAIANSLGVGASAVIRYLKTASDIGICDYDTHKAHINSQKYALEKRKCKVCCVTTGEIFDSIADARRRYNISSSSNIIRACNNPNRHAGVIDGKQLSWQYCNDNCNISPY